MDHRGSRSASDGQSAPVTNGCRKASLALARELLQVAPEPVAPDSDTAASAPPAATFICRHCGLPMGVVQIVTRGMAIRAPPPP